MHSNVPEEEELREEHETVDEQPREDKLLEVIFPKRGLTLGESNPVWELSYERVEPERNIVRERHADKLVDDEGSRYLVLSVVFVVGLVILVAIKLS